MKNKKNKVVKKNVSYQPNIAPQKKMEPKKKIKIRYGRILIAFIILILLYLFLSFCYRAPIKNIVIQNNYYLHDQEIIDLAHLQDYPSSFINSSSKIKKRLEQSTYIKSANVSKNWTGRVLIVIEENYPMFYYQPNNKIVLLDGTEVKATFDVPLVINYIPNTKYEQFMERMREVSKDILGRISEIKYDPNEVDDGRFLLSMSDGNYVYLTLTRFSLINHYTEIISKDEFIGKKGIIKLDAGNSFEILEG
ncbi:MAG: FtsQ-type POTRA domain-containing protein [Bacilli bacterium]|nr:FtsQ-type POTRA domain-containing protein [Bacilli bacterium]